jgi:hypothetical protein
MSGYAALTRPTLLFILLKISNAQSRVTPPSPMTNQFRLVRLRTLLAAPIAWQRVVRVALAPGHRQRRKSGCSFDVRQAHAYLAVDRVDQGSDDPPGELLSRIEVHRDRAPSQGCRLRCIRELLFGLLAPTVSKPISRIGVGHLAPCLCTPDYSFRFDLFC